MLAIKMSEYRKKSRISFGESCARVSEIVKTNGFAVLAEIRTSEILKSKGFDYSDLRTYDICNANYASKALAIDQEVEVIIPCHLIVKGVENHSEVSVQMPRDLFESLHRQKSPEVESFLSDVEGKLKGIVDALTAE